MDRKATNWDRKSISHPMCEVFSLPVRNSHWRIELKGPT